MKFLCCVLVTLLGTVPLSLQGRRDCKTNLQNKVQEARDKLLVVLFSSKWCPPCKVVANLLPDIMPPNVLLYKVDVDECSDLAANMDVKRLPTFLFYKQNKEVARETSTDINKLKEIIKKFM